MRNSLAFLMFAALAACATASSTEVAQAVLDAILPKIAKAVPPEQLKGISTAILEGLKDFKMPAGGFDWMHLLDVVLAGGVAYFGATTRAGAAIAALNAERSASRQVELRRLEAKLPDNPVA